GLVAPARVGAEHPGDRRIEVRRLGLAKMLNLLAVEAYSRGPGGNSGLRRRPQYVMCDLDSQAINKLSRSASCQLHQRIAEAAVEIDVVGFERVVREVDRA